MYRMLSCLYETLKKFNEKNCNLHIEAELLYETLKKEKLSYFPTNAEVQI